MGAKACKQNTDCNNERYNKTFQCINEKCETLRCDQDTDCKAPYRCVTQQTLDKKYWPYAMDVNKCVDPAFVYNKSSLDPVNHKCYDDKNIYNTRLSSQYSFFQRPCLYCDNCNA